MGFIQQPTTAQRIKRKCWWCLAVMISQLLRMCCAMLVVLTAPNPWPYTPRHGGENFGTRPTGPCMEGQSYVWCGCGVDITLRESINLAVLLEIWCYSRLSGNEYRYPASRTVGWSTFQPTRVVWYYLVHLCVPRCSYPFSWRGLSLSWILGTHSNSCLRGQAVSLLLKKSALPSLCAQVFRAAPLPLTPSILATHLHTQAKRVRRSQPSNKAIWTRVHITVVTFIQITGLRITKVGLANHWQHRGRCIRRRGNTIEWMTSIWIIVHSDWNVYIDVLVAWAERLYMKAQGVPTNDWPTGQRMTARKVKKNKSGYQHSHPVSPKWCVPPTIVCTDTGMYRDWKGNVNIIRWWPPNKVTDNGW